jgi:hypothetical protein
VLPNNSYTYVQDAINAHFDEVSKLLMTDCDDWLTVGWTRVDRFKLSLPHSQHRRQPGTNTAPVCDHVNACRMYLCGDAKGLSRDMMATFVQQLMRTRTMTQTEAVEYMMHLKRTGRYVEDVWS